MRGTALIYRPGENAPEIHELQGSVPLELLQKAVGGYIEAVPGFGTIEYAGRDHACVVFCNENGKLDSLPANTMATRLWHRALPEPGLRRPDGGLADVLVGPVIVLFGDREFMDDL